MSDNNSGGGPGLGGVTFVVFLVLKLTSVINWSWWWITAPLWGPAAFMLVLFVIIFVVKIIAESVRPEPAPKFNYGR